MTTVHCVLDHAGDLEEYCLMETFRPRCWKSEVIIVEEAIYGRRRVGKCMGSKEANRVQDPQYFGCFANVLHIVGRKCSGRKECTINILRSRSWANNAMPGRTQDVSRSSLFLCGRYVLQFLSTNVVLFLGFNVDWIVSNREYPLMSVVYY